MVYIYSTTHPPASTASALQSHLPIDAVTHSGQNDKDEETHEMKKKNPNTNHSRTHIYFDWEPLETLSGMTIGIKKNPNCNSSMAGVPSLTRRYTDGLQMYLAISDVPCNF